MCDWVTLLCSRKFTEHFKPAIMEKNYYKIRKKLLSTFVISMYFVISEI